jgi:hypothetical protein
MFGAIEPMIVTDRVIRRIGHQGFFQSSASRKSSRSTFDKLFGDWWWNGVVVGGETFEVKRDCFLNVRGGFRSGLTLRDATGKRWNFRNKYSVLILLDQHTVLHTLPPGVFQHLAS